MRNPNGQGVTDTDMSGGNKYLNRKTVKLMALASAGAIVLLFLCLYFCSCPFLPSWVSWDDGSFCDRTGVYETVLKNRKVTVKNVTGVIWSSPENVMVQKALSCDADNDHMDELVLLCWRKGQYGAHKPFWVEENDNGWSQHLLCTSMHPIPSSQSGCPPTSGRMSRILCSTERKRRIPDSGLRRPAMK